MANERGGAQTIGRTYGVVGVAEKWKKAEVKENELGSSAGEGESPVNETRKAMKQLPEYDGTRGIQSESGSTTIQG